VALAEMALRSAVGCRVDSIVSHAELFSELPSRILVASVVPDDVIERARTAGVEATVLGVAGGDDDLQRIRTIRRWGLIGVQVEIVIDELAECVRVSRASAGIVEVLVVGEDRVADHTGVGTVDRRVGGPRGEAGGRNPHFVAPGRAERWIGEIVPAPVNGIRDHMIKTERAVGNERARSVLRRVGLIHYVSFLPDASKGARLLLNNREFSVIAATVWRKSVVISKTTRSVKTVSDAYTWYSSSTNNL